MRRTQIVDAGLRELFDRTTVAGEDALVALGGYGRRMLSPRSDVDLLILHPGADPQGVSALAERLLYPLWDAGLRLGHAVRTAEECLEEATERLDTTTGMLDGRLVAGDLSLWERVHAELLELVRGDPRAFTERLASDREARRDRFGSVSSLLEPNLKEGPGGLRDGQVLGWLRWVIDRPLEEAGLLRRAERRAVGDAEEFLMRARSAVHLESMRASDRLILELQPAIAEAMGYVDEPGLPAVDGLMRSVFEHARQLEHVSGSVLDRSLWGPSETSDFDRTAEGVLLAFVPFTRERRAVPPASLDAMVAAPTPDPDGWTPEIRRAFLELIRSGPGSVRALETLDRIGLLERYLPAWSAVRCRPQRDPYHRSSVDVHLLDALARAGALLEEPGGDPTVARAVETVDDPDAVLIGALLHDIGKTGEGDHVTVGLRIAGETLDHMGVTDSTADLVLFLVAEHLLLSDTATRRDLEDEELVLDLALRIGDPARLAALYLLTIADAEATGPLAWTPWRSTLVRELVAKIQHVLERRDVGSGAAERLADRGAAIRAALAGENADAVERFLARMPSGYVLAVPLEHVVAQFRLIEQPIGSHEVRMFAVRGSRPDTYALAVAARDRPGLLSMIAGALSLAGLSILSAQVFTTDDGSAVDLFEVEGAFEVEVGEDRWREFRATLRRAVEGRLSLDDRVHEKRSYYPAPRQDIPVRVAADNDVSDFFTVIEVGAPDRLGLLFDLTRTFAEMRLDVHLAKVATFGERVVDAFYVRDELGRKIDDPEQVAELERALRARIRG